MNPFTTALPEVVSKQPTNSSASVQQAASEGWVAVTENDALQVIEADAEASFTKPHSSVDTDAVQDHLVGI